MPQTSQRVQGLAQRILADPGLPPPNPTRSLWQTPPCADLLRLQSATLPEKRDVVIIGSGVTGCSVAWWLLKNDPNLTVTVLEAREVCSGATGRNGGRIHCTAVQDYAKYSKLFGKATAQEIVRFELVHLQAYQEFAAELGPEVAEDTELRQLTTVSVAFDEQVFEDLKDMLLVFQEDFPDLAPMYSCIDSGEVEERFSIPNSFGALVYGVGAVWPYRLFTKAFQHMRSHYGDRFAIETSTPVNSVQQKASQGYCIIQTPRGNIHARHVVHCTEGHVAHLLPGLQGVIVPLRGQMTVQAFEDSPPARDVCWSFLFGASFDYATPNPKSGDIWIGGGSTMSAEAADDFLGISSDSQESVLARAHLKGILPVVFCPQRQDGEGKSDGSASLRTKGSWSGIMGFSLDHRPFVGRLPPGISSEGNDGTESLSSGEWISAGYGGYGMVNGFLCGKAVANMILGSHSPQDIPEPYLIGSERLENLPIAREEIQTRPRDGIMAFL